MKAPFSVHILGADILVAPSEEYHGIDEQGQQEVDQHTANHDEQTLPGRFGSELPRLGRLLHLLGVEALVNHAAYLAIAAKGQPSYAILSIAVLGLELKEASSPFSHGNIEEKIEFLYAYSKKFGEEKMATLVQQHEQGDGQYEL